MCVVFSMLTSVVPDSIQNDTGEKQPVTWYCCKWHAHSSNVSISIYDNLHIYQATQVPIDEMVTPAYADPSDIIPENKGTFSVKRRCTSRVLHIAL